MPGECAVVAGGAGGFALGAAGEAVDVGAAVAAGLGFAEEVAGAVLGGAMVEAGGGGAVAAG